MNDLFTHSGYPNRAGFKRRETSRAAADAIEADGHAETLRDQVLKLFAGGAKLTADECAERMGRSPLSIRPRVAELLEQGKLVDTGDRRKNDSGRPAIVWRGA